MLWTLTGAARRSKRCAADVGEVEVLLVAFVKSTTTISSSVTLTAVTSGDGPRW